MGGRVQREGSTDALKSAFCGIGFFFLVAGSCSVGRAESAPPILDPSTTSILELDISPDGQRLVWLATHGDVRRIHVRDLYGSKTVELADVQRPTSVRWAGDNRHVYVPVDPTGSEQAHLLVYDTAEPTRPAVDVTPFAGKKATLIDVNNPDGSALVGLNLTNPSELDLYRVKPGKGRPELIERAGADGLGWLVTTRGSLFGRIREGQDRKWRIESRWPDIRTKRQFTVAGNFWGVGDGPVPLGDPQPDGSAWFMVRGNADTASPRRLSLATGAVVEEPLKASVDVDFALIDPVFKPLIIQSVPDYPELRVFDPKMRKLLQGLPLPIHSFLRDVVYDRAMMRLALRFQSELGEENVVFIDRAKNEASILYRQASPISPDQAPRTQPVTISARDKLPLHGYLTLPADRPGAGLPLIVLVHGGPWLRDTWGWDFNAIPLASQGYAVLRVNYRGSGGYGRTFEEAGIGEWGGKMQDDLTDAACWAVSQHIADPRKMVIMGGSYGGYAAIEALVRTPSLFTAAISLDGAVDLPAMIEESAPYAKHGLGLWKAYIGEDRAVQWDRSPLAHIDRIERPILAFQGVNDPRVKVSQLEKLERAMLAAGKPLKANYLVDEGHGISSQSTFVPYMRTVLEFLRDRFNDSSLPEPDLGYCR